jgi:hypothetical protein
MATNNNSELTNELIESIKLQIGKEALISNVNNSIQPVVELNPKLFRKTNMVSNGTASNATTGALFTTKADRDTFITYITLSTIKDATNTSTYVTVLGYVNDTLVRLCTIACLASTAQSSSITINFPIPIQLQRNKTVSIEQSNGTSAITTHAVVGYYEVLNVKA